MSAFPVPTKDTVSDANRAIFETLEKQVGMVPNLYATFAHSENALGTYLALQGAKSSLPLKAREVINLVVSQVNECAYCLAAHTALGKRAGFDDETILAICGGHVPGDAKLDALAVFAREVALERGKPGERAVERFLDAGWTRGELVDTIVAIGDKIVSNYLHGVTDVAIDFPPAPALESTAAVA